jgi:hypothetical protein
MKKRLENRFKKIDPITQQRVLDFVSKKWSISMLLKNKYAIPYQCFNKLYRSKTALRGISIVATLDDDYIGIKINSTIVDSVRIDDLGIDEDKLKRDIVHDCIKYFKEKRKLKQSIIKEQEEQIEDIDKNIRTLKTVQFKRE